MSGRFESIEEVRAFVEDFLSNYMPDDIELQDKVDYHMNRLEGYLVENANEIKIIDKELTDVKNELANLKAMCYNKDEEGS